MPRLILGAASAWRQRLLDLERESTELIERQTAEVGEARAELLEATVRPRHRVQLRGLTRHS
eukprot:7279349-Prymnesium_polylepis.1